MATIERICTSCGNSIQVPEELETFSCVYCGATMTVEPKRLPIGESCEEDRSYALEHLIDGVRDNPKYFEKNFKKATYTDAFYSFKQSVEPTYQAMDRYVAANPERREELLAEFVEGFMASWKELHKKRRSEAAAFADKMTLALIEVPAIMEMELGCGPEYCELLEREFNATYPKNEFHVATFDDLHGGFTRRKLCFITTAICEFEGKPDDCPELTAFRAFRDGWMQQNGDQELIERYYEIAPAIVSAIDFCDDRSERYAQLRRDYHTVCVPPGPRPLSRDPQTVCNQELVGGTQEGTTVSWSFRPRG